MSHGPPGLSNGDDKQSVPGHRPRKSPAGSLRRGQSL